MTTERERTLDLETALAVYGLDVGAIGSGTVAVLYRDGSALVARAARPTGWHLDRFDPDGWEAVTLADDPIAAEPAWWSREPVPDEDVVRRALDLDRDVRQDLAERDVEEGEPEPE